MRTSTKAIVIAAVPFLVTCGESPSCTIAYSGSVRETLPCSVSFTRDGESFYTLFVNANRNGEHAGGVDMAFTALPTSGTEYWAEGGLVSAGVANGGANRVVNGQITHQSPMVTGYPTRIRFTLVLGSGAGYSGGSDPAGPVHGFVTATLLALPTTEPARSS